MTNSVDNLSFSTIERIRYLEWLFLVTHLILAIADDDYQFQSHFFIYGILVIFSYIFPNNRSLTLRRVYIFLAMLLIVSANFGNVSLDLLVYLYIAKSFFLTGVKNTVWVTILTGMGWVISECYLEMQKFERLHSLRFEPLFSPNNYSPTEKLQPDVILMDIQMPICDGVTATREIVGRYPWMRILVLTTFDDDEYIGKSLQAGAKGYLLKRKPTEEMAMAIRAVNHGYAQLSPEIAPKVFAQIKAINSTTTKYIDALSPRELEVLKLISHGKNNREISTALHLSIGTVKNYITQILSKLEARYRIAAALWARENLN